MTALVDNDCVNNLFWYLFWRSAEVIGMFFWLLVFGIVVVTGAAELRSAADVLWTTASVLGEWKPVVGLWCVGKNTDFFFGKSCVIVSVT